MLQCTIAHVCALQLHLAFTGLWLAAVRGAPSALITYMAAVYKQSSQSSCKSYKSYIFEIEALRA